MEQMQATMMYMLQAMTAQRPEAPSRKEPADTAEKPRSEDSDFRSLMKKTAAQKDKPAAKEDAPAARPEEAVLKPEGQGEEGLLQELAAMQNLYMEAGKLPVVQMAGQQPVQTAAVQQPAEVPAMPQQGAAPQEAQPQPGSGEAAPQTAAQAPQMEQPQQSAPQQQNGQQSMQQNAAPSDEGMAETAATRTKGAQEQQPEEVQNPLFGEVETAPIKVSETTQPQAAATPESVEAQIEEPVTEAIRQGETRVEIHLEPEQLGKVTVELTQREDGTIHVALRAENGETRSLLEKDLPGLQQLLARNSQQEVQVEVPRHQESQQQDLQDGHKRQNQQQQEQRQRREHSEDFLSRLRLGLVTPEDNA